ncbi:MAG: XRE family transcriptional regulator [Pseudomonadota bacterium]
MSDEELNDPTSIIRIARENGEEERALPVDLGQRVRDLRKARSWTLEQAAQQAGLARSTLSKIENGQMSPTYEALKKLAVGLDISVPQLFTAPSREQVNGRMVVTAANEGTPHPTATYEHEILAGALTKKMMLPYRARVRARSIEEFEGWVRHDGEEFLYVLTGVIQLYTEFYEPVEMRRGDSAYYDATMGHNVVSISQEDATILWVTSLT